MASHHVDEGKGCHVHPSAVPAQKQTLEEDEVCSAILSPSDMGAVIETNKRRASLVIKKKNTEG